MELKCAIIDDEPLARECIANYISEVNFLKLVGTGNNPLELSNIQERHQIDLVFLDIQMPIMSGIEFLKLPNKLPMVILTTAYPNYALEGFELEVMDYLLKPIIFSRFFKAVTKVKEYYNLVSKQGEQETLIHDVSEYFFLKCDNTYEKIYFNEILYIEAMQNYVIFYITNGKKYITLLPLKKVEEKLQANDFLRVHKSYIVALNKIGTIKNDRIHIGKTEIPIGRNYKTLAMEKILNNRVWKK
ncbi:MAG: LytTR family DNA-binding domain-containing protein [Bacteroidota bacterium]